MMKNALLYLFLALSLSAASFSNTASIKGSEYEYLESIPSVQKLLERDSYYKEAMSLLSNKKKMAELTIKDPETKKRFKTYVVSYSRVLELLKKSVEEYKNPISAIKVYKIILLNAQRIDYEQKKFISLFAKTMYAFGLCYGYLSYGDIFEKGLFTKVDKKRALDIYEEGVDVCKKLNNWKFTELMTRIYRLKNGL